MWNLPHIHSSHPSMQSLHPATTAVSSNAVRLSKRRGRSGRLVSKASALDLVVLAGVAGALAYSFRKARRRLSGC